MRYTHKVGNKYVGNYDGLPPKDFEINARQKLGKLEDLEEEIGCPLEVLFKALINGIYAYNGNHYVVFLKFYYVSEKFRLKDVNGLLYPLDEYKNTWWLKEDKSE